MSPDSFDRFAGLHVFVINEKSMLRSCDCYIEELQLSAKHLISTLNIAKVSLQTFNSVVELLDELCMFSGLFKSCNCCIVLLLVKLGLLLGAKIFYKLSLFRIFFVVTRMFFAFIFNWNLWLGSSRLCLNASFIDTLNVSLGDWYLI